MPHPTKPTVVYHADWSCRESKRWCAKATLGTDGHYTAFAPEPVGNPSSLIERLHKEIGDTGCAFTGFDFPIGVPAFYAKGAEGVKELPSADEWCCAVKRHYSADMRSVTAIAI